MSIDTAISQTTPRTLSEHSAGKPAEPEGPNTAVIATIENHDAQLIVALDALTEAVFVAVTSGDYLQARDELHNWYRDKLLPHAAAEERALYLPASELEATRLLICAMLTDHRSLVGLIAALGAATGAVEVTVAAAAARAVFTVHVSKENDLLLWALDQAGLDLSAALDGMHEILGPSAAAVPEDAGCGCGCACADDAADQTVATLPIVAASTAGPVELDVRALGHDMRHEIIFGRVDQLEVGARWSS